MRVVIKPIVISPTIQEFAGERYYLCGKYFQNKRGRLHLAVWRFHRGEVPAGHHIHHRDDDRSNNALENLECLTVQEHLGDKHGKASGERGRPALKLAQVAASAWHKSEQGRRWHAAHFERRLRGMMQERVAAVCEQCGETYMAVAMQVDYAKFCGPNCRAKDFRRRHRSE